MKKSYSFLFLVFTIITNSQTNVGITGNVSGVYINEFHYDNTGSDTGEFIEVAGPAGTDLSSYTITLYNGNNNMSYDTIHLTGIIANENSGNGTISFDATGIQNGAPDGIALSKTGNTDIQFISYEGVISAMDGPAAGLNSVDISISETGTTPVGYSLEYDETTTSWIVSTDDTPGILAQGAPLSIERNNLQELKIFPNPVSNGILRIEMPADEEKTITIYDPLGKQLLNTVTSESTINIGNLNNGIYFIKITEENRTTSRKLVVK